MRVKLCWRLASASLVSLPFGSLLPLTTRCAHRIWQRIDRNQAIVARPPAPNYTALGNGFFFSLTIRSLQPSLDTNFNS
uniref:Secreted protein n=1 Tax=Heterorhabditis bacteriophora TaxID=37862 RepID=A0A1I7W8P1_HETBA